MGDSEKQKNKLPLGLSEGEIRRLRKLQEPPPQSQSSFESQANPAIASFRQLLTGGGPETTVAGLLQMLEGSSALGFGTPQAGFAADTSRQRFQSILDKMMGQDRASEDAREEARRGGFRSRRAEDEASRQAGRQAFVEGNRGGSRAFGMDAKGSDQILAERRALEREKLQDALAQESLARAQENRRIGTESESRRDQMQQSLISVLPRLLRGLF
jgi:hypothetical protein